MVEPLSLDSLASDVQIPAGNYVLATSRGELPVQFQAFAIAAGETTKVKLQW
jgi:hypothetical protein